MQGGWRRREGGNRSVWEEGGTRERKERGREAEI